MTRQHISSSSTFEEQIGYSRAVVDDDYPRMKIEIEVTARKRG